MRRLFTGFAGKLPSSYEKRFAVYPVYLQAFLQRFKFLISFLKSQLKTKTKLKYRYRQKITKYRGTGTTKVPMVPVQESTAVLPPTPHMQLFFWYVKIFVS